MNFIGLKFEHLDEDSLSYTVVKDPYQTRQCLIIDQCGYTASCDVVFLKGLIKNYPKPYIGYRIIEFSNINPINIF